MTGQIVAYIVISVAVALIAFRIVTHKGAGVATTTKSQEIPKPPSSGDSTTPTSSKG